MNPNRPSSLSCHRGSQSRNGGKVAGNEPLLLSYPLPRRMHQLLYRFDPEKMEEDPFAKIKDESEHSISQEERLRHRPFYRESEARFEFSPGVESSQGDLISVVSTGIVMCSLPETPIAGGGGANRSPSEEFRTPQENLLVRSQEQTVDLARRVVDDHYKELKARGDVSTEQVRTVDLGKDSDPGFSLEKSSADKGFFHGKEVLVFPSDSSSMRERISDEILGLQSKRVDGSRAPACEACVDHVAENSGDSAVGKNTGLLKQNFEETVSLQCGGVSGEIAVGKSKEESFAEKRKQSEDYQIAAVNAAQGVLTSPLKASDKDPENNLRRDTEICSSAGRIESKKSSKGDSTRETPKEDFRTPQVEEFRTPQETLLMSSQEQTVNLASRAVDDHHTELKTRVKLAIENVATADLDKDSDPGFALVKSDGDKGFSLVKEGLVFSGETSSARQRISEDILGLQWKRVDGARAAACGACEDNVAQKNDYSAFAKSIGLLKRKIEETVSLQCGGVPPVGNSNSESQPAEKRNQSEDFQIDALTAQEVSTSPLKAKERDPEIGICRETQICRNAERGSSKKTYKGQSKRENASKDAKSRPELPLSIRGLMQNAAKCLVPDGSSSENHLLTSQMDTIAKLSGEKNASSHFRNVDVLEIVEQRGLKFSRPRWWPPEGF